ncbi:Xaa-Pro dipeptidase [Pseudonocardia hierapolitana]|uniref:Xaa-Pro dipeptidase n=1 Tax=Pseudonocardia hierapolitana TaxID=1128676 RepID=A0A561SXU4_9PSEU|nr:Xaa-Pro peptidase family protein [Pseudonocardia hierapolitana]TWF79689.1 Xaa-Pro dipeptidase [Pseudonocardia hierapolitana]
MTITAVQGAPPPHPHEDSERHSRIKALRAAMATRGLVAVALTSPENVYYLLGLDHLGYFAFTMLVLPAEGDPVLVTREMERTTVLAQVPEVRHVTFADGEDPACAASRALRHVAPDGGTVGIEGRGSFLPPAVLDGLRAVLPALAWEDCTGLLASARAVQSATETGCARRAAVVSDAAMQAGIAAARPGVAERDVAAATYHAMISAGGEAPGFVPLIRPVAMLGQEHVTWGDRHLHAGHGLFLELSGCVRRYHAPLSRTVYPGYAPPEAVEAAESALAGLAAARTALRPGARTGEVFAAWQRAVGGMPRRHHCGYLVGIGYPPSWVGGPEVLGIRPGGDVEVVAGMVFHLMSWVERPVGHVVSDTALVTEDGCELLTTVSRELTVVA